jgi:hypothetical protein
LIGSINDRSAFKAGSPKPRKTISVYAHHDDLRSFIQVAISVPDQRKGFTFNHTHSQQTNAYKSVRSFRLMSLTISYTFYMHIITYKKQGTPDQRSIQLLLLSTCTSPRTKVRGSQSTLPINVSNQLLYFVHAHRHVQKARDSRSMLHTASITFNMHITAYKK